MVFCSNCGAEVPGRFCPNCGAPVTGAGSGPTAGSASGFAPPPLGTPVTASGLSEPLASALCYTPFGIGLICEIIFLVAAPYNQNRTIRFNAFQGLFLHLALFVLWFLFVFIGGILTFMTHGIFFVIFPLFWLAVFILLLVMMFKAYNGQRVKLPLVGDFAEKQA